MSRKDFLSEGAKNVDLWQDSAVARNIKISRSRSLLSGWGRYAGYFKQQLQKSISRCGCLQSGSSGSSGQPGQLGELGIWILGVPNLIGISDIGIPLSVDPAILHIGAHSSLPLKPLDTEIR